MSTNVRQIMQSSPLFEGLQPGVIDKIAASATRRTLGKGEILYQKGDPADALWGVLSGRIVTEVSTEDGKELLLDIFGEGEVFGEVGVLDFGPRQEQARATEKSQLFRLERKRFLRHLQGSPELCFRVFSLLCSHLRDSTENLEDTALYKLPERLAKRLTMLSEDSGNGDGAVVNISQSDLASMLGVHRQAINRHLRAFEEDGLIELWRQRVEILDPGGLARLAGSSMFSHHEPWGRENLSGLARRDFVAAARDVQHPSRPQGRHQAGLMAIDAAEYSTSLMTDAAGTLKRIEEGLAAVDRAIAQFRGRTVWHTGDRVLAEFPNAMLALQAALTVQEQVSPGKRRGKQKSESMFRIGVHHGEVLADEQRFLGDAVNTAIRLTQYSGRGGVAVSGAAVDALDDRVQLELHYLGEYELKNVPGSVPIYSVRTIPIFRMLALRAETLVPRRYRPAAIAASIVILVATIWSAGDWRGRQTVPLNVSALSIAVLPFAHADPALEYLANGIPNHVRNTLARIPPMEVIGGRSSGFFNNRETSVEEMGRAFEVAWLLSGKFEISGIGLLVHAQLHDAVNNELVWEERLDLSHNDVFGMGSQILHGIAGPLGITDDDGVNLMQLVPMTGNAEAHANFVQAQIIHWRGRQRYSQDAIPLLKEAVELDPGFAEAHAQLADLYSGLFILDRQDEYNPEMRRELAQQSLQTALRLNPDSPQVLGHAASISMRNDDMEGALAMTERALRIDPNNTQALRNKFLLARGFQDIPDMEESSKQWMRLEPMSVDAMNARWGLLFESDRHEEALAIANRALAYYDDREVRRQANGWTSHNKMRMGDRLSAIEASHKAQPMQASFELWTGLEHNWEAQDDVMPVLAVLALVYVEDYDRVRELLMNHFNVTDPGPNGSESLDYLILRGDLEALAGDFESSVRFFEKARSQAPPDEEGGLVKADFRFQLLNYSRQSYFPSSMLMAYRNTGRHDTADLVARQWEEFVQERIAEVAVYSDRAEHRFLYQEAQYYAVENRPEEALAKLRQWVDHGVGIYTYIAWDPYMENLRGNPEFEEIVDEVETELAEVRAQFQARQAGLAQAEK